MIEKIVMKKSKEDVNNKSKEKPVSLYPLEFEEALKHLLSVKTAKKKNIGKKTEYGD